MKQASSKVSDEIASQPMLESAAHASSAANDSIKSESLSPRSTDDLERRSLLKGKAKIRLV